MRRSFVFVVCFALIVSAAPAVAAPPDNPAGFQRVIVQLRPGGPSPRGLSDQIVGAHGGRSGPVYEHALQGFAADLPQAAINALSHNPNVVSITPDQIVAIADQDIPTGFDRIEADRSPAAPTSTADCPPGEACTDVDIAVLDTGSSNHPDLNVVHRVDCSAIFGPCADNAGYDGHGHGTHVAGIAAALNNTHGVVGVAPGARVWSVKVLGDDGTGFLTSLIAGVDWVAARADQIDVVNMSLAGAFTDASFDTAIANSVAAGITFVVAAGNEGVDAAVNSPANHPDVIAVSAVADGDAAGGGLGIFLCRQDQTDDTLATFSNFGAVVDIAAPGVCIRSTWRDGGYATKSGTSMASPYVAGAAARYVAIHPDADPATVKAALLADGIPQGDAAGFIGDTDGYPEPLLFVNGPAFGGNGVRTVADSDPTPPPAPTLTALPDGYTVNLAWSPVADPESGILSYQIKRDGLPLAEVDHVTFAYLDRGDPGVVYSYEVSAVNRQGGAGDGSPAAAATTASDDPTDAGWWPFDDGTGTMAADASAWRRPGTLVDGPFWSDGTLHGALTFDGGNDRVDLDHTILNGSGDITAAFWVNTTKSGEQAIISGANGGNSNEYLVYLASPTNVRLYTGSSATAGVSWNLPHSIADGQWHHLAVVRDDTRNRADLYLEGTWVGAWGVALDPIDLEPGGLLLGQDQDSVGGGFQSVQAFSGTLDEMRLYTRVLSAAEIAELADADTTPPSAPPSLSATADVLRVDLAWPAADDPESGISAYEIWRGTGGPKSLLATVSGAQTSYPDARTAPTTTYLYEVVAVNGSGLTGPPSTEASATTAAGSGDAALVGWWKLDETTGGAAVDSSDYGLDGALVNGPVWEPGGQIDGALTFDGSNDRVDLDAQILDGAADVTVALWVKTTKTGIQALVSGANAGNDAEFELVMLSNPDLRVRFYTGETNETHVMWATPGLADGQWHHLAVTRDATAGQAVLYVDGEAQGSRSAVFNELAVDWGGLLLGQEQDLVGGGFDPTQAFQGSLDDVRLYRRLLSETEIGDLAGLTPPDTTPPVIALLGANPQVIEGGDPYVELGASAVDDVDGDISGAIQIDASAVDTLTPGLYSVTYVVEDSSGNVADQVVRTVNVVDTTPPVITLVGANPQVIEARDLYVDLGATATDIVDGNLSGSIQIDASEVDMSTPGSYSVTYDVSDAALNAAVQVTRTVNVVDTTAPVITLLGDPLVTVELDSTYVDAGATAFDVVDGVLTSAIVIGGTPVDTSTVGTHVVTYDVVDSSGNAAVQVTRTVEVVAAPDTTPPVITLLGDPSVTADVFSTYEDAGATAWDDADGDLTGSIVTVNPVDPDVVGTYTVTYDVTDSSGNSAVQVTRTVEVVDNVAPIITLLGDASVSVEVGAVYDDAGATASDNYDGDLTSSIAISDPVDTGVPGTYTVTYDVSDSSGNAAAQVIRTVNVVDSTPPVITLIGDSSVSIEVGSAYNDAGATAYDIVDGDLTASIMTVNPVDTSTPGSYTVTYDVTDSSGNAAVRVSRTVQVVAAPVVVEVYAESEATVLGSVSAGDLNATTSSDDVYEVLTEHHQGGRPSNRVSALEHRWTFEIGNPDQAILTVEGWREDSADENEDFRIEYSTDGTEFTPLLLIDSLIDSVQQAKLQLPAEMSGTVTVRVVDTNREVGNASEDSVFIDKLTIMTGTSGLPLVSVAASDPTAAEAGPSSGEFTLTRSSFGEALTVEIALGGTAGPADYQAIGTSVDFAPGSSTATVLIVPVDDGNAEGFETVVLTVLPGSGYGVGASPSAEVTITDDDVIGVDDMAVAEETVHGFTDRDFTATYSLDDPPQAITEEPHVGGKRSRLEHIWTFGVTGGSSVVFSVEAYRSNTSDGFVFAYSTDGANWIDMLIVSKTSDDPSAQTFTLPSSISGTVYVRVQDTDRTKSDPILATIWVDHMFIRSG